MLRQFIARFRTLAFVSCAATALGIGSLAACGVKGPLKLPPPAAPATPAASGTGAGGSSPEAQPATTTEPAAPSPPKMPEPKP